MAMNSRLCPRKRRMMVACKCTESMCDERERISYPIAREKLPSSEPTPKRTSERHERFDAPNRTAERHRRATGHASK
jgi:hypothetical protein